MQKFLWIALMLGSFACTQTPSYEVKVKMAGAGGKAFLSQRQKGMGEA